jgi:hypothetical protein
MYAEKLYLLWLNRNAEQYTFGGRGTASRLAFTVWGQAAQFMLLTVKVTVRFAANAVDETTTPSNRVVLVRNLFIGILRS